MVKAFTFDALVQQRQGVRFGWYHKPNRNFICSRFAMIANHPFNLIAEACPMPARAFEYLDPGTDVVETVREIRRLWPLESQSQRKQRFAS